ncbi:MAG: sodium-dependent transporter [Myxococcales bacterium]|nr:sodium-dependent transporter [Myxococcales bacterium]
MSNDTKSNGRGKWGSRIGFMLAASGSAIGLGNLWKFPYITYKFGAGAFVLVYLGCIALVGLPIMVAEMMIGRRSGLNPVGAFKKLTNRRIWVFVGGLGVTCGFILLSYYSVVAGWALEYTVKSVRNDFANHQTITDKDIGAHLFAEYIKTPKSKSDPIKAGYGSELSTISFYDLKSPKAKKAFLAKLAKAWGEFAKGKPEIYAKLKSNTTASLLDAFQRGDDYSSRKLRLQRSLWVGALFGKFVASPAKVVGWHLLFMLLTMLIVVGGVSQGIERASKILMPLLLTMLVYLVIRALGFSSASESLAMIFRPNFHALTIEAVLEALGHSFFTLSLGMGAMLTYGSYLSKDESLTTSSIVITALDTLIALMATIIIFCAIHAFKMPVGDGGVSNLFRAIPAMFQETPGGNWLTVIFYVLVAFAALTSTISLLEVVVSYFIDERGWSRRKATLLMGSAIALLGVASALSLNAWANFKPFFGKTVFEFFDYTVSNWFLPLGGLFVALFVGWVLPVEAKRDELKGLPAVAFGLWHVTIRYISPLAVAGVFVWLLYQSIVA